MKAHEAKWPGPLIVKPAILGDIDRFRKWRKSKKPKLVYSSVFETAIGFHAFIDVATSDPKKDVPAIGAGTLEHFGDHGFQLYKNSARLSHWQFSTSDFDAVWDQL